MLQSKTAFSRISVLGLAGRMALTNYLAQSLICAIVFYGYAMGYWGMPRAQQVLFVLVVYAAQIVFSSLVALPIPLRSDGMGMARLHLLAGADTSPIGNPLADYFESLTAAATVSSLVTVASRSPHDLEAFVQSEGVVRCHDRGRFPREPER